MRSTSKQKLKDFFFIFINNSLPNINWFLFYIFLQVLSTKSFKIYVKNGWKKTRKVLIIGQRTRL